MKEQQKKEKPTLLPEFQPVQQEVFLQHGDVVKGLQRQHLRQDQLTAVVEPLYKRVNKRQPKEYQLALVEQNEDKRVRELVDGVTMQQPQPHVPLQRV